MAWRRRRVPCLSRATCGDHSPVVRFRHAMAHRRPRQQDLHKRPGQRSDFAAAPKGSEGDDGVVWRSTLVSWVQGLLVLCFLFGSTAAAFFSRYFSFLHSVHACSLTNASATDKVSRRRRINNRAHRAAPPSRASASRAQTLKRTQFRRTASTNTTAFVSLYFPLEFMEAIVSVPATRILYAVTIIERIKRRQVFLLRISKTEARP